MVLADSDRIARVPSYLGTPLGLEFVFTYATVTLCGLPFQAVLLTPRGPTADPQPQHHLRDAGLGFPPVSLATTSGITHCFLFLRVLRCFTSPGSLLRPYVFRPRSCDFHRMGFPHSDISGSTFGWQLPGAFRSHPRPSSPLGT